MQVFLVIAFLGVATALSEAHALENILLEVRRHTETNFQFSSLEAATLLAQSGKSTRADRSPIQEISALADMMLIHTAHDIDELMITHNKDAKRCHELKKKYSTVVRSKKLTEDQQTKHADIIQKEWIELQYGSEEGQLLSYNPRKAYKRLQISRAEDKLSTFAFRRQRRHELYLTNLQEHQRAMDDVQKIRLILQNSNLDNRAKVGKTNSGGKKATETSAIKSLIELKPMVHPKITGLVELSHRVVETKSGMDKIYELLYKVRDQLIASQNKIIRAEALEVDNWRTNRIAFRNDINDLKQKLANLHMQQGACRKTIGLKKVAEGVHRKASSKAVKEKEDKQILKNFKTTFCKEQQQSFSQQLVTKNLEKKALQAVQKKLRQLKWSSNVYKAIQKVSEGVNYLNGTYNIRSRLGRYLIRDGSKASFSPTRSKSVAQKFSIFLNDKDLTYSIMSLGSGTGKQQKKWYLSEKKNKIFFQLGPSKRTRWTVKFDKKSSSMFIRNKKTRNTLFVDATSKFSMTTAFQTTDKRSLFLFDRSEYQLLGCYKNKIGKGLENYIGASNDMNTGKCYRKCVAKLKQTGFKYFGLTNGKQCSCGNTFWEQPAHDSKCGIVCQGRTGELCGGIKTTLVYRNVGHTSKPVIIPSKPTAKKENPK